MERCPPLTVRRLLQVGLLLRWPFGEQKAVLARGGELRPPWVCLGRLPPSTNPDQCREARGDVSGQAGEERGCGSAPRRHWDRIVGIRKRLRGADECGYKELWLSV